MPLDAATPLTVSDKVLTQELDGECVLLDLSSEAYFGLDDVGTRIWQALAQAGSIGAACDLLVQEYEVRPESLLADVTRLAGELVERGLLRVDHASQTAHLPGPAAG